MASESDETLEVKTPIFVAEPVKVQEERAARISILARQQTEVESKSALEEAQEELKGGATSLNLSRKRFRDAECQQLVHILMAGGSQIKDLGLACNGIKIEASKSLAQLISSTKLIHLDLSWNDIGHEGVTYISAALKRGSTLQELNLCSCNLADKGAEAIANALTENHYLQALNLKRNHIGNDGGNAIATALGKNSTLKTLILRSNKVCDEKVLKNLTAAQLSSLDLGYNGINSTSTTSIALALRGNSKLQTLELCGNPLENAGVSKIMRSLQGDEKDGNTTLVSLDLRDTQCGDEGALAAATTILTNSSLRKLNLKDNPFTKVGIGAIAKALEENHILHCLTLLEEIEVASICGLQPSSIVLEDPGKGRRIILSEKSYKSEDAIVIGALLKVTKSLYSMDLGKNYIGPQGATAIAEGLEVNQSLVELDLRQNKIGYDGAVAISQALERNKSVTSINLSYNQIGDGMASLAAALRHNTTIRELALAGNQTELDPIVELSDALRVNKSLTYLDLRDIYFAPLAYWNLEDSLKINRSILRIECPAPTPRLQHRLMVNNARHVLAGCSPFPFELLDLIISYFDLFIS